MTARQLAPLLLALAAAPGRAAELTPEAARHVFSEIVDIATEDAGRTWGVSLNGPVLLVERSTRAVLANRPSDDDRLEPVAPGIYRGVLDDEVNAANTATEWAGRRWTMLLWPLPRGPHDRRRLLAHELFHRIQPLLGHAVHERPAPHLDSPPGRTWLRLELRALAEALVSSGWQRRRAVQDALVFRARRHEVFEGAAEAERLLEVNEGLAEYTGLKLSGLSAAVLPDRAAQRAEVEELSDAFARTFAYATGPAYALLLDAHADGWRRRLDDDADLAALVARALRIRLPGDLEAAVDERVHRRDGLAIVEEERHRAERRQRRLQRLRARFVDGPVVNLPASGRVRYGFDPGAIESLPGAGQVFAGVRVTDAWGVLEAAGGALLVRDQAGNIAGWRVPADGEGWSLDLARGWSLVGGERVGDRVAVRDDAVR